MQRAIRKGEVAVAQRGSIIVGFTYYVVREDIIDGGPNSFIPALYVAPAYRNKGVGFPLLERAIFDSRSRGVVGIETSTIHSRAKKFYERHRFKQTFGDMGETFLELNVDEYLKAKGASGQSYEPSPEKSVLICPAKSTPSRSRSFSIQYGSRMPSVHPASRSLLNFS